ncbi:MAG: hypothetical protein M0Z29_04575 [Actinomycetota bacterium]|nr:hypothetical protein [Actinomycetota bacterium]
MKAETCFPNSAGQYCHWYAEGASGYGNSVTGTGADTTVWSHYSEDKTDSGFTDQAAWLENWNGAPNSSQSLEGGFYSGLGNNIPWTNGVLPYDTYSNGYGEHDVNDPLSLGTGVWIAVSICNGCGGSLMQVGSYVEAIDGGRYQISTPRYNYSQAEVGGQTPNEYGDNNPTSWICGGSGDNMSMYWGSSGWNEWGFVNTYVDSPYQVSSNGKSVWSCSGYGSK